MHLNPKTIRYSFVTALAVFMAVSAASTLYALDIPKRPKGYVSDYASVLSSSTRQRLEQGLAAYERQSSNQILIATFKSLEGEALEDFSIRLAEAWKPGQADKDNGVLLTIFKQERKIRIEVGYGLEGAIPDALAGQIIQQVITPAFKKGQYDQGVLAGVNALIQASQGEYKAQPNRNNGYGSNQRQSRPLTPEEIATMRAQARVLGILAVIAVLVFFCIDFFRYRGYLSAHKGYQVNYSFWEWWFRFAILLFILNMIFKIAFYSMLFSRGGRYGGNSGFGGFSGGGGGSFGGGGASGGW
ncbi:MAG: hypothetical protein ACI9CF_001830 [Candidatus Omnitrophota bacterium]|jgi:uncharacterized protein